jgi:tRNA pseudouridine32 synthase/23S rRNA pseudouridine746 synthase
MQEVRGDPNSDTYIELMEVNKPWAKYRLSPGSGKKHQLRSHLNTLGIPIRNDQIYPFLTPYQEYDLDFSKPLQLLAKEIHFVDPISKEEKSFISERDLNLPQFTEQ